MYFPIAGIECHPLLPFSAALCVSFLTSMGGVSGAFLLLPFQMSFLGYVQPSVSATNQFYNVVAVPGGVWRFLREGRMLWPLVWVVILGTLPGVFLGAIIRVRWLPDPQNFKLFAAAVLGYIGFRMLRGLIGSRPAANALEDRLKGYLRRNELPRVQILSRDWKAIRYRFCDEEFSVSVSAVLLLTFLVGMAGGIYGIGGGAIISPFLVSVFGLPVYTIAGACLMGTFVTSVAGVLFYMLIAPWYPALSVSPDWLLGIMLGLGGLCGMYLGARCQKFIPARWIKLMLTLILLGTALRYCMQSLGSW